MDGFDDDRGVPPVDYETAFADALQEALPLLRLRRQAKAVLSEGNFEVLEDVLEDELTLIADSHGDRTDDLGASDAIYDDLRAYELEDGE